MKLLLLISSLFISTATNVQAESLIAKNASNFVKIIIKLKKANKPSKFKDESNYYSDYLDNNNSLVVPGIIIDSNIVMTRHLTIKKNEFDSVQIVTYDGKRHLGAIHGIVKNYPFQTFTINGKFKKTSYAPENLHNPKKKFSRISINQNQNKLFFSISDFNLSTSQTPFQKESKDFPPTISYHYDFNTPFSLILNQKGEPSSILSQVPYHDPNKKAWFTPNEVEILTYDELNSLNKDFGKTIHKSVFLVHLFFKVNNKNNYYSSSNSQFEDNSSEAKIIGILQDDKGSILLPYSIPIKKIKQIKKIVIQTGNGALPCTFGGTYKKFHGIKIKCNKLIGQKPNIDLNHSLKREELFFTVPIAWTNAQSFQYDLIPNYAIQKETTLNDEHFLLPQYSSPNPDAFYLNSKGKIIGIQSKFKNENFISQSENSYFSLSNSFLPFEAIKSILSEELFNKSAIPEKKKDSSPNWLGVNTQPLTDNIIEKLKASKLTVQGKVGYLVNSVYEDSPAHKLGIKPLDIVLGFEKENGQALDLNTTNHNSDYNSLPFPSRRNSITDLLSKLEKASKLKIKLIRNGELITKSMTLEKAPKDFKTTEKYICPELGIHVKNLTYEVRKAFRISKESHGILISHVVRGKPASIHRVFNLDIIKTANGKKIYNVGEFKKIFEDSLNSEKKNLEIMVTSLGKSHIVKFKL